MPGLGHLSSSYVQLLSKIYQAGGVPCEDAPDLFFPEDLPEPELRKSAGLIAKSLCQKCPVLSDCFEYALTTEQKHGIWGGTSPDER